MRDILYLGEINEYEYRGQKQDSRFKNEKSTRETEQRSARNDASEQSTKAIVDNWKEFVGLFRPARHSENISRPISKPGAKF